MNRIGYGSGKLCKACRKARKIKFLFIRQCSIVAHDLAADTPFLLTGAAGVADRLDSGQTSAAIIADNAQLAVFDWRSSGPYNQYSTFSVSVSGSTQYLTFAGLSGLDGSNWADHIGFANVQLTVMAIPEPSTFWLIGVGVFALTAELAKARSRKS